VNPPVSQYGISVSPPAGWDARIYRRSPGRGETSHPVVHAANFALPQDRGDYGSGAVEQMVPGDAFVSLLEFDPASAGKALFASNRRPGDLTLQDFSANSLQRALPGQLGVQRFFAEAGRAFCLYVVFSGFRQAGSVVPVVNGMVQSMQIGAAGG
jgi:hypothetical protein